MPANRHSGHCCHNEDALILDEDGIYDPASFNDRLLLGLKGTMSEAEPHVLSSSHLLLDGVRLIFSEHTDEDMTKAIAPRNLTPGLCQKLEAEMLDACASVAARHGLKAEALGITAMNLRWNFDFGVRVSIPRADGTTIQPERLLFEVLAPEYGLQPEDFGREFSSHGERFRITGLNLRRPRFPVSAVRIPDGKGYKFTAEDVAALLQLSMKDVSPKS